MAWRVEFSKRAEIDVDDVFAYIRADSLRNAVRWRERLERKLSLLTEMPEIFGLAPENHDTQTEVRQLLFGQYRVLYTVRADRVLILTVRHGARQFLSDEEVDAIE
jgi:plasmid stabilization system protein ParE